MATTTSGTKVYTSILDLPVINDIRSGDSFIVQSTSGTALLPYASFLLPLDHTEFNQMVTTLWDSYEATNEQINLIGNTPLDVNNLGDDSETLCDAVNQLNDNDISNYNEVATKINEIINFLKTKHSDCEISLLPTKS